MKGLEEPRWPAPTLLRFSWGGKKTCFPLNTLQPQKPPVFLLKKIKKNKKKIWESRKAMLPSTPQMPA